MVNVGKLRGRIVEQKLTMEKMAELTGIDRSTFYRKLSANGESISIREADLIVKHLDLSKDEAMAIFFHQPVA